MLSEYRNLNPEVPKQRFLLKEYIYLYQLKCRVK